jgi:low temperature requirement protein LtrA
MVEALKRSPPQERNIDTEQEVTALELFFDLVFVFAITQVTGFLDSEPTWVGLVEAGAILMVLWFAWSGYAWLGNTAATDEGPVRVVLLAAMGPLLIASLAVPHAFGSGGLIFGLAYFLVRSMHILAYAIIARGDPALRGVVFRLARTILPAASLLVLAGTLHGTGRALAWAAALTIDYAGLFLGGTRDWRVEPRHFSERHRLVIIIALGESIVALGVGARDRPLTAGVTTGALLGIGVAAALWWAYFDVVAVVAERRLRAAGPVEQSRIARDSYSYLHLPMVAGIVVFAFGVEVTLEHVGARLDAVPAAALCGGVALYLLALSTFKRRNIGSFNVPRLLAAGLLALLAPFATLVPALLSLGVVAAIACGLIAFEVVHYAEARDRIRHGDDRLASAAAASAGASSDEG